MSIQPYPSFRPIELSDKPLFDKAFSASPPEISEFTFTNLYAWREAYGITVSILDGILILRANKGAMPRFFNPIGSGDAKAAIERVSKETRGVFIRVPETTASLFDADGRFKVESDADNSDYVYGTRDLILLSGKKYDGKRNLIKKFKSTYTYDYASLDGSSAKGCLAFEEAWCSVKDCDSVEGLDNERRAIREMIAHFSDFALIGGAIKVNGRMCAVAIAERLNPKTLVMHAMKADPNMAGLYQAMLHEFLSRQGQSFEYVNLEQDLGVEGLRRSKLSYHPITMVKKYTLTLTT